MFGIGLGEAVVLLVVGLLVLGPERLPEYTANAVRFVRTLRRMAHNAQREMRATLEPELRDLKLDLDFDSDDEPRAETGVRRRTPARSGQSSGEAGSTLDQGTPDYGADAT